MQKKQLYLVDVGEGREGLDVGVGKISASTGFSSLLGRGVPDDLRQHIVFLDLPLDVNSFIFFIKLIYYSK